MGFAQNVEVFVQTVEKVFAVELCPFMLPSSLGSKSLRSHIGLAVRHVFEKEIW
jgi:hypothetical protein